MTTTGTKPLHDSSHAKLFLVNSKNYQNIFHHDSPDVVIMKVLKNEYPDPDEIEHFYKEYDVLQNISHPGVRRVFRKTKLRNKHTVFLECVDGITIRDYRRRGVQNFLSLSRQIVEALAELHRHRIVHNNINTRSVMVNTGSGQIKIIGLGQSVIIGERVDHLSDRDDVEGDLQFMSPDEIVDYRSDLYSLGCVFYFMLTGRVPFECDDQCQLLDMHRSLHPPTISEVDASIPAPVSNLVQKLMNKDPNHRYQSAEGVLYDLKVMISQFQSEAGIASDFMLALKDCSGQFHASRKLYGRTDQIAILLSTFERVCTGTLETVLVTGNSGTGKSSLVDAVQRPVIEKRGYFIGGKYEPLQLFDPSYSGILQAFTNLCDLLLAENEIELNYFRQRIHAALSDEGKILTDVIPKLHSIIGDQPDVPEVSEVETKNRFNHVFRKFVKAISTAHRPILLFIDDLQWADSASLGLLSMLMMDKEIKYLLFVGAYRDDEVDKPHPLVTTMDNKENGVITQKIKVCNLSKYDANELISDALNDTQEDTSTLTDVVYGKTFGNAFFVIYFLKTLVNENLLYFCYDDLKWKWDIEKILWKNITENVVDFMLKNVAKLPKKTLDVLKIASCFGNNFNLFLLELVIGDEDVTNVLREAFFEGIIIPGITDYKKCRFSHDRIQQAVYSLIPGSDRGSLHLRIGRILQAKLSGLMESDENLFVVVNQLNTDSDMIVDENDRTEIARLNLRAAEKARMSSALELAAGYLSAGIMLLGSNRWTTYHELSIKIYFAAAEMDYCNGDFDHMNEMLGEVFENATSVLDKVESFSLQIKAFRAQKRIRETLDTGIRVLGHLGVTFSDNPSNFATQNDLFKIKYMISSQSNDAIASMMSMEDERIIASVRIMCEMLPSARLIKSELHPLLVLRVIEFTMEYGCTKYSIHAFGQYGSIMCAMGNFDEGHRIGKLLQKLLDRFPEKECQCWVNIIVYFFINPWKEKIHLSLKPLQHAFQIGLEVGNLEHSFNAIWRYCCHSFLGGNPLITLEKEVKFYSDQSKAYKQNHILIVFAPLHQAVLNFMGKGSDDPTKLEGEVFSLQSTEKSELEENFYAEVAINFSCMILAYFFHKYDIAAGWAEKSKTLLEKAPAIYENSNHVFYHGLISLALAKTTKDNTTWIEVAIQSIEYMKNLAGNCPNNFLHKAHLLEAELAAVRGCILKAMEHFNKAINLAEDQSFMHEEALACEKAGIFCVGTKQNVLASKFLSRSYQVYREWGAEAKALQLQRLYGKQITKFSSR